MAFRWIENKEEIFKGEKGHFGFLLCEINQEVLEPRVEHSTTKKDKEICSRDVPHGNPSWLDLTLLLRFLPINTKLFDFIYSSMHCLGTLYEEYNLKIKPIVFSWWVEDSSVKKSAELHCLVWIEFPDLPIQFKSFLDCTAQPLGEFVLHRTMRGCITSCQTVQFTFKSISWRTWKTIHLQLGKKNIQSLFVLLPYLTPTFIVKVLIKLCKPRQPLEFFIWFWEVTASIFIFVPTFKLTPSPSSGICMKRVA